MVRKKLSLITCKGKIKEIKIINEEIINGEEHDFTPARDSSWRYKWMEASTNRCHIKILSTVLNDSGTWKVRGGINGDIENQLVLIQGMYVLCTINKQ